MKKQLILAVVFGFIIFGFGFANFVQATVGTPISGIPIGLEGDPGSIKVSATTDANGAYNFTNLPAGKYKLSIPGQPTKSVIVGTNGTLSGILAQGETLVHLAVITPSDLGINDVGTLPTSRFYFLKKWGRGIERLFAFSSVVKAQVELKIANKIAAETLVLEEKSPNDKEALKKSLENYTKAQERLNEQLSKLSEKSENPNIAELLKKVDEKTAKHVALFNQITQNHSDDEEQDKKGVRKAGKENQEYVEIFDEALSNTLKTFTITVTPVNDEPAMKQKAEEQIKSATVAITEAGDALAAVSTTRGINVNPGGVDVRGSGKVIETIDEQSSIFDRWGNMIAKAKIHLDNAKKAFAESKYGEAYGQARSAEAIVSDIIEKDTKDDKSKNEDNNKDDESKNEDSDKEGDDKNDSDKSIESTLKINDNESPKSTERESDEEDKTSIESKSSIKIESSAGSTSGGSSTGTSIDFDKSTSTVNADSSSNDR